MKTYSQYLREKLLAAIDRGMPRKEAVSVFGVSQATLKWWLKPVGRGGAYGPYRLGRFSKHGMTYRIFITASGISRDTVRQTLSTMVSVT